MSDSLWPHGLYSPWNSPDQNTGVGSLSLLQGIFPTQGLNPGLPHCRQILYQLSHKASPRIMQWVAYPFSRGSSWPRNQTRVSCIAGGIFTNWVIREIPWRCPNLLTWWRQKTTLWENVVCLRPNAIHVNVWQKLLQYCKVISLQRIKSNGKKQDQMHFFLAVRRNSNQQQNKVQAELELCLFCFYRCYFLLSSDFFCFSFLFVFEKKC